MHTDDDRRGATRTPQRPAQPPLPPSAATAAPTTHAPRPWLPMAVGFWLLALPLFAAIALADGTVARVVDVLSGVALVAIGVLLARMRA